MKRIISLILSILLFTLCLSANEPVKRYSYVLMEGSTATLLYADNGNYSFPPKHSAKLMTLLLAVQAIEKGELSTETVVKVSPHANSMEGSQIWLRIGEEISVHELILSVTAGNANDACVALAEAVAGDEGKFIELMNEKAKELGMADTYYADCTGISTESYTTASDTAIVASYLSRYNWLDEYFKTYMTNVRNGQTELVNTNRLLRSYDYCTGMKYYFSEETENCLIASARKDRLDLICVILGESDKDTLFRTAKEKFGIGFSAYTMYSPKATDVYCEPVKVSKSVTEYVDTAVGDMSQFVVRKSQLDNIKVSVEYFDNITAPLRIGDIVGKISYIIDGEEVYSCCIVAGQSVEKISFWTALGRFFTEILKL